MISFDLLTLLIGLCGSIKFGTCARELLEDDAQEEDVFNLAS